MSWPIIVGLVCGIPLVLLPVALVWYLNISGLYQVVKSSRERKRRRAEALRLAAEPAVAGPG
jgi:hypothetical protein